MIGGFVARHYAVNVRRDVTLVTDNSVLFALD